MDSAARLAAVRAVLAREGLDALVVPTDDAHQSEYVAACDARRAWLSGFTGSAGTAVVTRRGSAVCYTDGRYFLQAAAQLDGGPGAGWRLMKARLPETPSVRTHLERTLAAELAAEEAEAEAAEEGGAAAASASAEKEQRQRRTPKVAIDGWLFSKRGADELRSTAATAAEAAGEGESASAVAYDLVVRTDAAAGALVDAVWAADGRPAEPQAPVFVHALEHAGESVAAKVGRVRAAMAAEGATALVVSALDQVAWLFNLRGSDISHNPVFFAYAVVREATVQLYVDERKLDGDVRAHLAAADVGIEVKPYLGVFEDLPVLQRISSTRHCVWLDPNTASQALFESVGDCATVEQQSPITMMQALKNDAELDGMRSAHLYDAVAKVTFLHWLGQRLEAGDAVTECTAADALDAERAKQPNYVSLSFDSISAAGPNAAIIHYKPEPESCAAVTKDAPYLIDSGGQYRTGTTDVTRTVHYGTPTPDEKKCFTLVLQGHIALDAAVFPEGTDGKTLDVLARMPLWKHGLDYLHGTGHGVGAFLNVHEGPQGIHNRHVANPVPLQPGMTVTDEPGYYEAGKYGFRIENCLIVRKAEGLKDTFPAGKQYLCFEHVTLIPMQTKMIEVSMLSADEIAWVNAYNAECLAKVGPLITDPEVKAFMEAECAPLPTA